MSELDRIKAELREAEVALCGARATAASAEQDAERWRQQAQDAQQLLEDLGREVAELREWKAQAERCDDDGDDDPQAEELREAKAAAVELASYIEDVDSMLTLERAVVARRDRILRLANDWTEVPF